MGCAFSADDNTPKAPTHITVVVASEGRVVEVEAPSSDMKVGELLLEFQPAHFLARFDASPASVTSTSERASPLSADADAVPDVYVLFPMPRLHSRLSPQERQTFALLLHKHRSLRANKVADSAPAPIRRSRGNWRRRGARVAPLVPIMSKDMQHQDDNEQGATLQEDQLQSEQYKVSINREQVMQIKAKPWAPSLATIKEGQGEC